MDLLNEIIPYVHYAVPLLGLLCLLFTLLFPWRSARHKIAMRQAKRVFKTINQINQEGNANEGWLISYLRKINPFTFEELILLAFEKKGYRVQRNARYTGDGGIDGTVFINGHKTLIQAKRYKNFINQKHLYEFGCLCREQTCNGLFIHTGRTGDTAKKVKQSFPEVKIISGKKLDQLFLTI